MWERFQSTSAARVKAHNVFTASLGVPRAISTRIVTLYNAWKIFIRESILRKIIQYTNEGAQRREAISFCLDLQKLEAFTGIQYARGVYEKGHPVLFCGAKNMEFRFFTKQWHETHFLKY